VVPWPSDDHTNQHNNNDYDIHIIYKNTKKSEKEPISFTPTTAITNTVTPSPTHTYVTPVSPPMLPTHPTLDSSTMHMSTQQYQSLHPRCHIVRHHRCPKISTAILVPAAQTTDPSCTSSHLPLSLLMTTNSQENTIEHKAKNPHDPKASDTRPIITIPQSPRLPFSFTIGNTRLTSDHPPNIIKVLSESPTSSTSHQHLLVLAGLNKLQQQIEAMQATIQACLNKLQKNCLDPTLQDHTQKHPPHDPSSNKLMHPPLPNPIHLINFLMFG